MEKINIPTGKRIFDILMALLIAVALSPIILLLIIIFLIEKICIPSSRGPLFYSETRISQGEPFRLWKIRTFKTSALEKAEKEGVIHTKKLEENRKNLTYTGILLRQIYMDESPQLFSILIGDMSFVGPRPTNPENYAKDIERGLKSKKILRAGLTGTFQTHKHKKYGLNQEMVDLEYAEFCKNKNSLQIIFHDLIILIKTAITVLRAEGL